MGTLPSAQKQLALHLSACTTSLLLTYPRYMSNVIWLKDFLSGVIGTHHKTIFTSVTTVYDAGGHKVNTSKHFFGFLLTNRF